MSKKRLTIFIKEDIAKELKKLAIDDNLSMSEFIEKLLEKYDKKRRD